MGIDADRISLQHNNFENFSVIRILQKSVNKLITQIVETLISSKKIRRKVELVGEEAFNSLDSIREGVKESVF